MNKTNTRIKTNLNERETVRITVSIPATVNMFLKKRVPKRQISQFVADAISQQIPIYVAKNSKNSYLRELLEYRKKVKHHMTTEQIIAAINKGRL